MLLSTEETTAATTFFNSSVGGGVIGDVDVVVGAGDVGDGDRVVGNGAVMLLEGGEELLSLGRSQHVSSSLSRNTRDAFTYP